ncbi:dihydrofolate reductase [Hanamia caeni]|uniref:Dihydrofolate reductase n=1 Tax=Hanamia caeni TaxID=2294116 RepID=A0A3M9ND52_9BACT|nr:dihydrofolate reductase [Hanamia caeni]RNI35719.1 dihydrofolate reductase [Hanamia caeni]
MPATKIFLIACLIVFITSCNNNGTKSESRNASDSATATVSYDTSFQVAAQSFADIQVLRYEAPGFNQLSLQQKQLAYYLYEAALAGRDIFYDQKSKYGIMLRKTLEAMYTTYTGDKTSEDWKKFETYCGRFWFSNGNHHHYSNDKFLPECSSDYFISVAKASDSTLFPKNAGESMDAFLARIKPIIYDPKIEPKLVDLDPNVDNVKASSVNFYEGVTQKEVEDFYAKFDSKGNQPQWGLNSKVIKDSLGKVVEKVWKAGGMYSSAIEKIIGWLEKAITVAEDANQKAALQLLVQYYKTGDLHTWDDYNIAWVKDINSRLDAVNGFIEVYFDPLARKGSWESVVSMKDLAATKTIEKIASQAQWFEDHSPILPEDKKKNVKGIIAKAITVIVEGGSATPSTPIGINLPNNEWIRQQHGSKSVSLSNIVHAYNVAGASSGMLDEFALNDSVKNNIKKWGSLAADLHTDMHEAIGHASGQLNPGVATPDKTLKTYASALEEARADLVGLYFIMDPKLIELGVMPTLDVGKAEYDSYMMNGLMTQLVRLNPGANLEEAHMRNRQLNAMWAYEKGKKDNVVEFVKKDGKTYVKINDYNKLRELFGQLLREIQRIKSQGDYQAGKNLIETYGVKVDPALHKEVLERYKKLNIKPYKGFIQPKLVPVMDGDKIADVKIEYPTNFFDQMIEYGKDYSFLPLDN